MAHEQPRYVDLTLQECPLEWVTVRTILFRLDAVEIRSDLRLVSTEGAVDIGSTVDQALHWVRVSTLDRILSLVSVEFLQDSETTHRNGCEVVRCYIVWTSLSGLEQHLNGLDITSLAC